MKYQSGVVDQYIHFVAVDATDLKTREMGLTGFTVYQTRNGAAPFAYTTPTTSEVDATNMPGLYSLLLDEDMTIAAGNDSEAVVLQITKTGMAPVTLQYELYRPLVSAGTTLGVASNGDLVNVNTLDGQTPQSGDTFALANGASGFVVIDTAVAAIKLMTDALPNNGALSDLAAILTDTGTTIPAQLSALNDLSAAEVATELATYDGPTNAEMEARTLLATGYAAATNLAVVDSTVSAIKAVTDLIPNAGAMSDLAEILTDTGTTIPALLAALNDPTVAAIVAGVWGELQAGYVTPNTFGAFLDAAVSAAGGGGGGDATLANQTAIIATLGTLPTAAEIDTQLSGAHGAGSWASSGGGSGAYAITITVTDGSVALENVAVRVTEGVNSYALITDVNGNATFSVDAATYLVSATKAGYTFTPVNRTVTGNETGSIVNDIILSANAVVVAPADPLMCRVSGFLIDQNGIKALGAQVIFKLMVPAGGAAKSAGRLVWQRNFAGVTDANGQLTDGNGNLWVDMLRNDLVTPAGSTYEIQSGGLRLTNEPLSLSSSTYDLSDIVV